MRLSESLPFSLLAAATILSGLTVGSRLAQDSTPAPKPTATLLHPPRASEPLDVLGPIVTPPKGKDTIKVTATTVTLSGGKVIDTDKDGFPLKYPLAEAIRRARPGATIEVSGEVSGASIGTAADPYKPDAAVWPGDGFSWDGSGWSGGAEVHDITIQGADKDAVILGGFMLGDKLGGWANVTIRDVRIRGAETCLIVSQGSRGGLLRLWNLTGEPTDPNNYNGFGLKWFARLHGQCQLDARGNRAKSCAEHLFYGDNLVGPSLVYDCTAEHVGRTLCQFVERPISGPPGSGLLVMRSIEFTGAHNGYDGGSLLTVAGHLGDVWIFDVNLSPTGPSHGGIACWADFDPTHGLSLDKDGYAIGRVFTHNVRVNCQAADRAAVQVSGQREWILGKVEFSSNSQAMWMASQFSNPAAKTGPLLLVPGTTQTIVGTICYGGDKNKAPLKDMAALVKASAPVVIGTGGK